MNKTMKLVSAKYSRVFLLVLIVAVLAALKPEAFWTWSNISTVIFQQAPFTMLMSFGMTLAIMSKGIDKSMGSVLVLSSVIAAPAHLCVPAAPPRPAAARPRVPPRPYAATAHGQTPRAPL